LPGSLQLEAAAAEHARLDQRRGADILPELPERSVSRPSGLVNNVGITGSLGPDTTLETMRRVLDVNVLGVAPEMAEYGVRVNAVSPGTPLTDIHAAAGEPGRPQRVASRIPMRRPGRAEEIAKANMGLLSDRSSVTGTVLKVAGGL
jgi:NAD(P)-dependent dehydrogenase (short-subunit alcohol dehydrogenase family)